jgi:hypothetical protein
MRDKHYQDNPFTYDVSPGKVLGVGVFLIAFVVLSVALLITYFHYERDRFVLAAEGRTMPAELRDLRAQEDTLLTKYGWVDKEKGIVRIPVERARELLVREGRR